MKNTRYRLVDLIAQCDPDTAVPEDAIAWDRMALVGLENVQAPVEKTQSVVMFDETGKTIATRGAKSQ